MIDSYTDPYQIGYSAGLTGSPMDLPEDPTEAEEYKEGYFNGTSERDTCFTDPIPNNVENQLQLRYLYL